MSALGLEPVDHYDHAMEALEDARGSANASLREPDLAEAVVLSEMAQYAYGKAYAHAVSMGKGRTPRELHTELMRLPPWTRAHRLVDEASHRVQLAVRKLQRR